MDPRPVPAAWTAIRPRHLADLSAVARAGSFRAAARELGCSQSVLSQRIAQLERIVGVRVAVRRPGNGALTLTPAGEALLAHAERVLALLDAARADLAALAEPSPMLRLGVAEHLAARAAEAIARLLRVAPEALVAVVTTAPGEDLAAAVGAGRLDAALADLPDGLGALCAAPLAPEPYVLVAPAAWGVVRRAGVVAADLLAHLPVALAGADPDTARVVAGLRAAGFSGPAVHAGARPATVLADVRLGRTAAVLPAAAAPPHDPATVRLALDGVVAPRALALLSHGARRYAPLVDALIAAATGPRAEVVEAGIAVA